MPSLKLGPELEAFLDGGVTVMVATRNASLLPDCVHGAAARIEADRSTLTLFIPSTLAATTLANLAQANRIAVCVTSPFDDRSFQVKGRVVEVRPASTGDRPLVERQFARMVESLLFVGLPPRIISRIAHWPCQAVTLVAEEYFLQTPGPQAGAALAAATTPPSPGGAERMSSR